MGRKHQHEDHVNHEAWAIPYGDLVTLLLAFFVVMYAVSSLNEGKYRVMADAMSSAFGGNPRSISPIQLGKTQLRGSSFDRPSMMTAAAKSGPASVSPVSTVRVRQMLDMPTFGLRQPHPAGEAAGAAGNGSGGSGGGRDEAGAQLSSLGQQIQDALSEMVRRKLVTVRRGRNYLEVEIQSDILFASGAAAPSPVATATVRKLAGVLRQAPNAVRVEGYTDDRPIHTLQFTSNWELSSARAASVVHVLIGEGVGAERLAVVGFGQHQPVADNATEAGRNANRRVLLVILAAPQGPDTLPERGTAIAMEAAPAPTTPSAAPTAPATAPNTAPATPADPLAAYTSATAAAATRPAGSRAHAARRPAAVRVAVPPPRATATTPSRGIPTASTHPAATTPQASAAVGVAAYPGAG